MDKDTVNRVINLNSDINNIQHKIDKLKSLKLREQTEKDRPNTFYHTENFKISVKKYGKEEECEFDMFEMSTKSAELYHAFLDNVIKEYNKKQISLKKELEDL